MTIAQNLKQLAEQAPQRLEHLATEEATKNALVMPFIQALGYNVFDPTEVIPEYTADVGTKKGEKVDYAIRQNDQIVILVECKKANTELSSENQSQLYRYFSVTHARIAVLTNGTKYMFFSDLEEQNKMDSRPFMEFDLLAYKDELVDELTKLSKPSFDLDNMLAAASDLKCMREIRAVLERELQTPSEEFLRFIFGSANSGGRFAKSAKEQYSKLVPKVIKDLLKDKVNERISSALVKDDSVDSQESEGVAGSNEDGDFPTAGPKADGIETTPEEVRGFTIVRTLVSEVVDAKRVRWRDHKNFFNVLLDDSNRKPIARLYFECEPKQVGTFDANKVETRQDLSDVEDLARLGEHFRDTVRNYLSVSSPRAAPEPVDENE